jgi:GDSL-like Lipase/Acylhydrolase family/N-terminus of Esterase_SGNH_hydro-type
MVTNLVLMTLQRAAALVAVLAVWISLAVAAEPLDRALAKEEAGIAWYDARRLALEGRGWSEKDLKSPYDRLPARAEGSVRAAVWGLSHNSAGLCVRLTTDSSAVHCRWTLTSANLALPHMPATGVSGVDLYVLTDGGWRWLSTGRPTKTPTNEAALVSGLPKQSRQYLLYLPLYNGVTRVEIGVAADSTIAPLPREDQRARPLVFWGTSITQGGCASRPGMVHTAILGRRLNTPVVNLGFSGNGKMEPEVAELIAEIDAAAYVIDCLPNCTSAEVTERTGPLVTILRKARSDTPIVLVEDRTYADAFLVPGRRSRNETSRRALQAEYDKLLAAGVKNLHYLPGATLLGADGEDTVDGSHPTDLGFVRQADAMGKVLTKLVKP